MSDMSDSESVRRCEGPHTDSSCIALSARCSCVILSRALMGSVFCVYSIHSYFTVCVPRVNAVAAGAGAQGTSVLSPGFPVALLAVAAFVIAAKSHAALLEHYPTLYCATFSLAFAKLANQLIVRSAGDLLAAAFSHFLLQYFYYAH